MVLGTKVAPPCSEPTLGINVAACVRFLVLLIFADILACCVLCVV